MTPGEGIATAQSCPDLTALGKKAKEEEQEGETAVVQRLHRRSDQGTPKPAQRRKRRELGGGREGHGGERTAKLG